MKIFSQTIKQRSRGNTDIIDLSIEIAEIVQEKKIKQGTAVIFVVGSTAAITTVEYEPGLVDDLKTTFQKIAPDHIAYAHHERWGDDNGHSHVRSALVGPSIVVPIIDGKLALGTWQQVVLIDFDTRPRERSVIVQILGE